jgi:hypothetical protein
MSNKCAPANRRYASPPGASDSSDVYNAQPDRQPRPFSSVLAGDAWIA